MRRPPVQRLIGPAVAVAILLGIAALPGRLITAQDEGTPVGGPVFTTIAVDASPAATPEARIALRFVQAAGETALEPAEGGDSLTLTMSAATEQTAYFSDRPARVNGAVPTEDFVAAFADGAAADPPTAVLVGHPTAGEEEEEALVVALLAADYDADADELTYRVRLLGADEAAGYRLEPGPLTAVAGPRRYAEAHLFIDGFDPCGSVPAVDWVACEVINNS